MRTAFILVAAFLTVCVAQDSRPESRRERWRFRQVAAAPDVDRKPVVARAAEQGDVITVFADGSIHFTIEKTYFSDVEGDPPEKRRQHWVTQLPAPVLARVEEAAAAAASKGTALSCVDLLDLTRFPRDQRGKRIPHMTGGYTWPERHQEDDGSWSPGDFEFHCDEDNPPLCGGRGRERFRVAGTALLVLNYVSAGYGPYREGPYQDRVRRAIGWVLGRQRPDGGFAEGRDAVPAMSDACATILLCRTLAPWDRQGSFSTDGPASRSWTRDEVANAARMGVGRIRDDQRPDGSWSDDPDDARKLSATVWSLLALRAGTTAGISSGAEHATRALGWIEKQVASVESRPASDPVALMRSRASRAVARATVSARTPEVTADVTRLVDAIEAGGPAPRDAETILFGALAAANESDLLRDRWMKAAKPLIVEQARDGCAAGSFAVPTIWWDDGGRVVSTAMMTWALEVYYRYPLALWLP